MTKDDVIRLAREAKLPNSDLYHGNLEAFAKLIAEHERKEFAVHAVDIARRAVAEEREACWGIVSVYSSNDCRAAADAIRARGQA